MRCYDNKMSRYGVDLYRCILRQHRLKLAPAMRKLGDDYLRNEFRLHKNVSATGGDGKKVLHDFNVEWNKYLQYMVEKEDRFGRDMSTEEAGKLNEMQRERLEQLRKEANTAFK